MDLWKGDEDMLASDSDNDDEEKKHDDDNDNIDHANDDRRYVPRRKQALLALKLGEDAADEDEKEELVDRARDEDPGVLVGWKVDLGQWMGGKGFILAGRLTTLPCSKTT